VGIADACQQAAPGACPSGLTRQVGRFFVVRGVIDQDVADIVGVQQEERVAADAGAGDRVEGEPSRCATAEGPPQESRDLDRCRRVAHQPYFFRR
jgi:hypothetical protein